MEAWEIYNEMFKSLMSTFQENKKKIEEEKVQCQDAINATPSEHPQK